ncbi:hypothetical protein Cme02nite_22020 [Catellatospora methionotrophica]|uniref:Secreted protein n=1 Tax=Catellatospora methionotrophica TaxID=121620 RepID=A0A8J3LG69_9ACTN|nr:hypothetical protein [Catellatospora methionotrophica]GIG13870.1 hypothetical protein Cme02nite_22020 [Catellatospora methionotrophica]
MNRIVRAVFAAATTALLAVAVSAAPAAAADPPKETRYRWLSCPPGTSTTATIDNTSVEQYFEYVDVYFVHIVGTVVACRTPTSGYEVFGLAAYGGTGAYGSPRPFPRNPPPEHPLLTAIRVYPGAQAVCVIADETTRLACVSLSWAVVGGTARPTVTGPLAVDSPLVAAPAVTDMTVPTGGPGGPGCVLCPDPF